MTASYPLYSDEAKTDRFMCNRKTGIYDHSVA